MNPMSPKSYFLILSSNYVRTSTSSLCCNMCLCFLLMDVGGTGFEYFLNSALRFFSFWLDFPNRIRNVDFELFFFSFNEWMNEHGKEVDAFFFGPSWDGGMRKLRRCSPTRLARARRRNVKQNAKSSDGIVRWCIQNIGGAHVTETFRLFSNVTRRKNPAGDKNGIFNEIINAHESLAMFPCRSRLCRVFLPFGCSFLRIFICCSILDTAANTHTWNRKSLAKGDDGRNV